MVNRAGLQNEDMEFVQFHPTGINFFPNELPFLLMYYPGIPSKKKSFQVLN